MDLAWLVSSRSKDPSTQVGAVIVNKDYNVVSTGYNGFPPGYPDTADVWDNRELKYDCVVHAECNAVARAAKSGRSTENSIAYVTHLPCLNCAKTLISAGVKKVIYNTVVKSKSADEWNKSITLMETSGLEVIPF